MNIISIIFPALVRESNPDELDESLQSDSLNQPTHPKLQTVQRPSWLAAWTTSTSV